MLELRVVAHDDVPVLQLVGRFDGFAAAPVVAWLKEQAGHPPARTVVNLGGVAFMDSTALGALVQGMKRCREAGGDLRVCTVPRQVRMIFELTRLDQVFRIFDSESEAAASYDS